MSRRAATALDSSEGFARVEGGHVVTRTGIRIGSAWLAPAPQPGRDGEAIQRLLLQRRRRRAAALHGAWLWLRALARTLRGAAL